MWGVRLVLIAAWPLTCVTYTQASKQISLQFIMSQTHFKPALFKGTLFVVVASTAVEVDVDKESS